MIPEKPDYLVFGQLRRDFLITPERKVIADQPGGNLLYAVEGAGLWLEKDEKIGLVARVGEDYPRTWLDQVAERGYLIEGINILQEEIDLRNFLAYTDLRTTHRDDPVGHFSRLGLTMPRSLLGYSPESKPNDLHTMTSLSLRVTDLPDSYKQVRAAHLCSMDYLSQNLIPPELRQSGIEIITLDPGDFMNKENWEDVQSMVIGLTVFLPSEEELRNLFSNRTDEVREMVEEIALWGVQIVVAKMGWQGQLVYDGNTKRAYEIPAYPSKMVDPTGAGHVFGGGFMIGLEKTSSPIQAAMYGNVAASFAVEGSGVFYTQDALPGLQQARLESIRKSVREV
jgi:ribokinase